MEEAKKAIKELGKKIKRHYKRIIQAIIVLVMTLVLLAGALYFVTVDDGTYKEDDWSSTPFAASQYTGSVSVEKDGTLKSGMTAQELWDKMLKNKSRVNEYLKNPEELARLMRAEIVTQYPDTRPNPDEEINWDEVIKDADLLQGIIKFKRADVDGNKKTMSYVSPEEFQGYIDEYNSSGSETAKQNALTHFTLKKATSQSAGGDGVNYNGPALYWPTDGTTITSYFGPRSAPLPGASTNHGAIDIGVPVGTNVYACEKGTVTCASMAGNAGNLVTIDHGNGYVTKYMHNSVFKVNVGDTVEKGQVIALAGSTGNSTGPHVHFQIEYNGTKIDPLNFKYHNGMGDGTGGFGEDDEEDEKDEKDKEDKEDKDKKDDKKDNKKDKNTSAKKATATPVTDGDGYRELYTSSGGITYKHYKQFEGSYAENPYWNGTIHNSGCGPTAVATLASGIVNSDSNPGTIAAEMNATYGVTSYSTLQSEMNSLGMPSEVVQSPSAETIQDYLKNGKVMLVSVTNSTIFTNNSHIMALVDINDQGQVYICNPGSSSLHGWYDIGEIMKGCQYIVVTDAGKGGVAPSKQNTSNYVAVVATWRQQDTNITSNQSGVGESSTLYSMTTTNVNYEEMVDPYTMPFDLLWALLVVGEDKNFVFELADLVYNSKIEITVHDNLTVNTDIDEWHYTQRTKAEVNATITAHCNGKSATGRVNKDVHDPDPSNPDKEFVTTKTVVTQTNTLNVVLTKADVWIVKYENEFVYVGASAGDDRTSKVTKPNQAYPIQPSSTGNSYSCEHIDAKKTELRSKVVTSAIQSDHKTGGAEMEVGAYPVTFDEVINVKYYQRYINIYDNITNKTSTQKYVQGIPVMEEKTDKKSKEPNFVTIFRKKKYKLNKSRIKDAARWLFEIIENNESTADMLDLIKYLLYKATGVVYDGIESFDFGIFYPSTLQTVGEGDYIVHIDKSDPGIVIDDVETLKKAFAGYSGGSKLVEHAQEFLDLQEQYRVNAVFAAAVSIMETGGGRTGHAVNGKSNWFNIECVHGKSHGRFETYGSVKESIEQFYKQISVKSYYFTAGKFTVSEIGMTYCENADVPGGWIESVTGFMTQMFNAAGVKPVTSGTGQQGEKIIEAAKSKQGCAYVYGAAGPNTFDCSGLTQWCYKQVGIDLPHNTEMQKNAATKVVPVSQARVGDILWKQGHVGLYMGNNQYIHAPHTGDVVRIANNASGYFTYALQFD